jgi:hypothetical protein
MPASVVDVSSTDPEPQIQFCLAVLADDSVMVLWRPSDSTGSILATTRCPSIAGLVRM